MTSDDAGYDITKPPEVAYVFALLRGVEWAPVARISLGLIREGLTEASLVYGRSWLARNDAFALDPVHLPLHEAEAKAAPMFGALLDAGPDRWGAHLLDEFFQRLLLSASPADRPIRRFPNALDRMLLAGDDRVGALAFGPTLGGPLLRPAIAPVRSLTELEQKMVALDAGEPVEQDIERLAAGTSLGGARPKATVLERDGTLWLAKFRRKSDAFGHVRAEHASMTLAAMAGVTVAETKVVKLGNRETLLVRRFDRTLDHANSIHRIPFISSMSILGATPTSLDGSYSKIADQMRRIGCPPEDLTELYRRMLVNVALGNTDDHLRNHGFLYDGKQWRLSPAYDVVPSLESPGAQAISIGRMGATADLPNALSEFGRFGLSREEAEAIAGQVVGAVSRWQDHFTACDVPDVDIRKLSRVVGRLDPPARVDASTATTGE